MNQHDVKSMTDGAAVMLSLSGILGWLTPVVTLIGGILTIVWMAIRIYETDTVKKLIGKNA